MRVFGSFGVDVFFVISGYIMARILHTNSDFFFLRRVLRIVPPYWIFTILLFFVALYAPRLMGATRASGSQLLMSLFFIPFAKSNGLIQPLLFIGWSLNYEMFFYLALSIGLLFNKRHAVWIGASLVLATMLVGIPFTTVSVAARFYSRDIVLEFPLGILSYYVAGAVSDTNARRLRLASLAVSVSSALLLIVIQGFLIPQGASVSHLLAFGFLSFFLVTSASLLSQGGWDTNLSWLVLIGDASYILYLIHPYCLYSFDRILGASHPWLKDQMPVGAFIGVMLSIVLAVLLHLYGERPMVRALNSRFGGKRRSAEFSTPVAK
jgi:peptidoglycan/LPS O-acetylase OafA/YrhL